MRSERRRGSLVGGDIKGPRSADLLLQAVVAVSVIASATACRHYADELQQSPGLGGDVTIVVDNRDFSDATLYVYWNGFKTRAGTVAGKSVVTFRTRWRADEMRLEADFVGMGTHSSEVIQVLPGDELKWLIQPQW